MARRREVPAGSLPVLDEGRGLDWSPENRAMMDRAAWHGFREDSDPAGWDPPSLVECVPSKAWGAAFYGRHRALLVAAFRRYPSVSSRAAAWPVATFDPDAQLRAAALASLAVNVDRMARVRRQVAAEAARRDPHPGASRGGEPAAGGAGCGGSAVEVDTEQRALCGSCAHRGH